MPATSVGNDGSCWPSNKASNKEYTISIDGQEEQGKVEEKKKEILYDDGMRYKCKGRPNPKIRLLCTPQEQLEYVRISALVSTQYESAEIKIRITLFSGRDLI